MIETVKDAAHETLAKYGDVIDVRSPSEFAEDRVPGAINLPVLSDQERAEVGTIYVQQSRFLARRIGAAYVAKNVAAHLQGALADRPAQYRPLLYCWRGGMRSNAMATILSQIGWRVGVLEGGYRTWRREVAHGLRESDAPLNVVLLDGQTGTAKSAILRALVKIGVQTIDLEALAAHRGSIFGSLPEPQPSQKLFESEIWRRLRRFDPQKPVVIEAESAKVGALAVPPRLWKAMTQAPCIEIAAPLEARAAHILGAYSDIIADAEKAIAAVEGLSRFHSKETIERWTGLVLTRDFVSLVGELMVAHYDPRYDKARRRRAGAAERILLDRLDPGAVEAAARRIVEQLDRGFAPGCAAPETVLSAPRR